MHEPLRVMQLALSLVIGGTEKLVHDIVHQVNPHMVTSVICCLDHYGYFGEKLQQEGYPVYVLHRKPGIDWTVIKKLRMIISQEKINVIHAHQYTPYFYGLLSTLFCKLSFSVKAPKIIFTEHGRFYPDQRRIKRIVANPLLSFFTDEIVSISKCTKSALIKYENFPGSRIKVVYNGIDPVKFSPNKIDTEKKKYALGLTSSEKVVGIVARLDPIKNHAMLLRAFKRVLAQFPQTSLIIVGDGPEEQKLKTLAQSLGVQKQTLFLGTREDIPELLPIFDVFALSSFSEGTSVTLLEAMAAGLPIVATRVGGNPEVIKDQETGYLVPNDDEYAMAESLIKLLQDRETRQKLGKAGRKRVYEKFTLAQMVKTYTDLYLGVCQTERNQ